MTRDVTRDNICSKLKIYLTSPVPFGNIAGSKPLDFLTLNNNLLMLSEDDRVDLVIYIISSKIYSNLKLRRILQLIRYKYGYTYGRREKILLLNNVRLKDVKVLLDSKYTISIIADSPNFEIIRYISNISLTSITFDKHPEKLKRSINYYEVYTELRKGGQTTYKVPWAMFLETRNKYSVAVLHHPSVKDQVLNFLTKWRSNRNKIRSILTVSGLLYSCQ